jgi:hypothetical protein
LKRLVDEDLSPGTPEHELAELVRATPRFEGGSFERERILVRLRGAAASPARRVRTIGASVFVLSVAAVAAAAMGGFTIPRSAPRPPSVPSSTTSSLASLVPVVATPPAAAVPSTDPAPSPSPAQALAPNLLVSPVLPKGSREPSGPRAKPDPRSVESRRPDGEDPAPILEAIRALRSRGDAAQASALLADYLRAHPRSVLSEDALALSIEAAVARHDPRSAADLGHRYLEQFPNGRYKSFASQAVRPSHD